MLPMVVIVGRENVGKSTLFNRLVGKRSAVTSSKSGTTKDRNIKEVNIRGKSFFLVDTGGYWPYESEGIKAKVKEQIEISLESANLILFVVDAKEGARPLDFEFAKLLRKLNKKIILVVNKIDTKAKIQLVLEFHKLGIEEVIGVSAIHSIGIGELENKIKEKIELHTPTVKEKLPLFAIIGRPNVGKSTYINAVLKEPRIIVDEKPGTTVDSIDVTLKYNQKFFTLIDTPGLRRRAKIRSDIEYYSSLRTKLSILRCEVAILLIDASSPITRQDKRIISTLIEEGKGIVIAANKIDKGVKFQIEDLRFAEFIPIVYISALHFTRIYDPIEEAIQVWRARKQWVSKKALAEFIKREIRLGIKKIVQVKAEPVMFKVKCNYPLTLQRKRFIEKKLRTKFEFIGVPIKIKAWT
jgi:GTP-binding protein